MAVTMKVNRKEFLYIPNLLSMFRLVLLPVPIVFIARGNDTAALALVLLGIITDIADGYLARKLNQVSELGKLLDPLADKLAIASLVIALYLYKDFPLWAVAIIIGRDVVIILGSLKFIAQRKPLPMSNTFGKYTAFCWSLLVVSYLTPFTQVQQVLLIIAVLMVPISFVLYLLNISGARTRDQHAGNNHNHHTNQ